MGHKDGVSREAGIGEENPAPMHRPRTIQVAMNGEFDILAATGERGTKQQVRKQRQRSDHRVNMDTVHDAIKFHRRLGVVPAHHRMQFAEIFTQRPRDGRVFTGRTDAEWQHTLLKSGGAKPERSVFEDYCSLT